jgi:E1A/CREB-binding protein
MSCNGWQDILKQAVEDKLSSAAELPYFEGDFWPNVLEESIKELDQEEEEKRKQAEAAEAAAAAANVSSTSFQHPLSVLLFLYFW